MKKLYFFTMLAAMLFAVTNVMAQKANFKPANLKGIWQLCHYVSESPDAPGVLKPSNTFKVLSDDGRIVNCWYKETWKRIEMPDKFPEDIVR